MSAAAVNLESPVLTFESVARTHAGMRRTVNEDRVLDHGDAGLWAIADGMGGHRAGDVAAGAVIDALASIDHGVSGYAYLADIIEAVERANQTIYAGQADENLPPSGSTVVALLAHEGHYACLWAGDSRAYRFREGRLTPITRDHSLVQQLVDGGQLAESQRKLHPNAHVITRAVGADAIVELEQRFAPINPGDVFLLCSDGLTGCLEDAELADALAGDDLQAVADGLLATALNRMARDNVSLVLVRASA